MTEKIILGNIITMDDSMPHAEAAAIKDGIIVKVGTQVEVRAAVSESAEIMDYKGQWIYPGFLEAHSHGMLAGFRAIGQADLSQVFTTDFDKYREIIKQFIEDNPDKEFYLAAGWLEDTTPIDHKYLDDICSDKPLMMNTAGGHSCLLNTKAMEVFGINDASVEKYGTALVHVGPDGHPDGYICEEPCINLISGLPQTIPDIKEYLLNWQETALSHGITAVGEAGAELVSPLILDAYKELEKNNDGHISRPNTDSIGTSDSGVQLSLFQLEDPVLCQLRDRILDLDINALTPLDALNLLNDIKKIVKS